MPFTSVLARAPERGRSIRGTSVAGLAVLVGTALLSACGSPSRSTTTASASVVGAWNVTYGAPSAVNIEATGTHAYTMTAKTPVTVVGSSCQLASGTVIATFSGNDASYTGRHGLWNQATCAFVRWTTLSVTLNGTTAIEKLGNGEVHLLTRSAPAVATHNRARYGWWLWLLLLAALCAVIAYFAFHRRRQDDETSPASSSTHDANLN
jgi:hypothetical protein